MNAPILDVRNLVRHYAISDGLFRRSGAAVRAVDGVNFTIARGKTFGLVGESGCGKTTLSRQVLRVERPASGSVYFEGNDISGLRGRRLKAFRRRVSAVFQDPYGSLNPRLHIRSILAEPMSTHKLFQGDRRDERISQLLQLVGLSPAFAQLYPHQFSGGQRQRVAIARALSTEPALVVLDEPVSALDVSIRGQILNLLKDLQERLGVSYLLIAHDLPSVAFMSDTLAVMYMGRLVELAPARDLVQHTMHPYSKALLAAALPADVQAAREAKPIAGEVPSPISPPSGCRFHTRCPVAMPQCQTVEPDWVEVMPGHFTACHLHPIPEQLSG